MTRSYSLSCIETRALRLLLAAALLACMLPASRPAAACSPMAIPPNFSYNSPDGRFQLRIRTPNGPGTWPSGMYHSDDLQHPLWTLEWGDAPWQTLSGSSMTPRVAGSYDSVFISNDGEHLARLSDPNWLGDVAFTLYDRNRVVATFKIWDMATTPKGLIYPQSVPVFECWGGGGRIVKVKTAMGWLAHMQFDDRKGLLIVTLLTGDVVDIEISSGRIVRKSRLQKGTGHAGKQ